MRDLGVLDDKLTFSNHVDVTVGKANSASGNWACLFGLFKPASVASKCVGNVNAVLFAYYASVKLMASVHQ